MTEKRTQKKKGDADTTQERSPIRNDDRKRFGATAFFDSRTEENGEEETILSLDSLREAFAAFDLEQREPPSEDEISAVEEPEAADEDDESPRETEGPSTDDLEINGENDGELNPKMILEAMLFVGDHDNRPLTAERASDRMRNVSPEEIDAAVVELNRDYHQLGCPYHIIGDRDGYRMVLRAEFEPIREKFYGKIRETTLSQSAIDTLAIVAYRQPIGAEEVQKLRKEPCAGILSQLVRRGLLVVEREERSRKKILIYRTSDRFLELFGLDSLDDLPVSLELD